MNLLVAITGSLQTVAITLLESILARLQPSNGLQVLVILHSLGVEAVCRGMVSARTEAVTEHG